ncbi:hypothetical protein AAZV13_10G002700 [Glycine max]
MGKLLKMHIHLPIFFIVNWSGVQKYPVCHSEPIPSRHYVFLSLSLSTPCLITNQINNI